MSELLKISEIARELGVLPSTIRYYSELELIKPQKHTKGGQRLYDLKTTKKLRVIEETEVIEEILRRLGKGEPTITYGFEDVEMAVELGAVEKLVLADIVLREASDEKRLTIEDLMKKVEEKGGKIIVVSTEHEAGAKLVSLGGITALLRFPLR